MTPHQAAQAAHAGALHAGGGHADGAGGGGGHDDSGAHGPPTLRALNLRQAAADDKSKGRGGHSHGRAGGALRAVASGAKVATRTLSFGKSKKKKAAEEEGGGGAREAPARLQNGEFG